MLLSATVISALRLRIRQAAAAAVNVIANVATHAAAKPDSNGVDGAKYSKAARPAAKTASPVSATGRCSCQRARAGLDSFMMQPGLEGKLFPNPLFCG